MIDLQQLGVRSVQHRFRQALPRQRFARPVLPVQRDIYRAAGQYLLQRAAFSADIEQQLGRHSPAQAQLQGAFKTVDRRHDMARVVRIAQF